MRNIWHHEFHLFLFILFFVFEKKKMHNCAVSVVQMVRFTSSEPTKNLAK